LNFKDEARMFLKEDISFFEMSEYDQGVITPPLNG